MEKTYKIYLGYSWNYPDAKERLLDFLNSSSIPFVISSLQKDDPANDRDDEEELYKAIKAQIEPADIVIILAGEYELYKKWVDKEIKIAKHDFSKKIIAVELWDHDMTSETLKFNADKVIRWDHLTMLNDEIKELG